MRLCCFTAFWLVAAIAGLPGCATSPGDEEEHHAEHHIPEHKPATFSAAVESLEPRRADLFGGDGDAPADRDAKRNELRDIVGWLPELAAETDLKKSDWETVQRVSAELMPLVETGSPDTAPDRFRELVAQLRALAARSDAAANSDQSDVAVEPTPAASGPHAGDR
jgi:hypothetical protein